MKVQSITDDDSALADSCSYLKVGQIPEIEGQPILLKNEVLSDWVPVQIPSLQPVLIQVKQQVVPS